MLIASPALRSCLSPLFAAALLSQAGCIIGFKVDSSTSATASASASMSGSGSDSASDSASGTGTDSASDSASEGSMSGASDSESTSDGSTSGASTSDGSTSGASTSSGTTMAETEGLISECAVDEDCALYSDCCSCEGYPPGEEPAMCDAACDQSRCEALGITAAICSFGVCTTPRVPCDDSAVVCDVAPPVCGAGALPVLDPKGTCYTGECAPAIMCDVVPACALCEVPGWTCVAKVAFTTTRSCEPLPVNCEGAASCACAASQVCDDVFTQCSEAPDGLVCTCLDC